uniref:Uncharacterized protein n=1 Tax=Meloidogyne incognita TaxID=6306 RepID=A0A914LAX3_MELIC
MNIIMKQEVLHIFNIPNREEEVALIMFQLTIINIFGVILFLNIHHNKKFLLDPYLTNSICTYIFQYPSEVRRNSDFQRFFPSYFRKNLISDIRLLSQFRFPTPLTVPTHF